MKLSIFFSGVCFGAVVGLVAGYLVVADQLRDARQVSSAASHVPQRPPSKQPSQSAPAHSGTAIETRVVLDAEAIAPVVAQLEKMKQQGGDMAAVMPLIDALKARGAKDPKDFAAFVGLAHLYIEVGMWQKAAGVLGKAVAARDDVGTRLAWAQCHYLAGEYSRAARGLRELIKARPSHPGAHELLVFALGRQSKFTEAHEAIDVALESLADAATRARLKQIRSQMPKSDGAGS